MEVFMSFITRQGRALLMAAVLAVWAVCVSGCAGNKQASAPEKSGQGAVSKKIEPSTVDRNSSTTKNSGQKAISKNIETFTDDRDGQEYKKVKIGNQVWMAENLRFNIEKSWCYENSEDSCGKYGRLYSFDAAKMACPKGWHLPSRDEWRILVPLTGDYNISNIEINGNKLRATSGWNRNGNGTDDFGFSALPGGARDAGGNFEFAGDGGYWWTAEEHYSDGAYALDINRPDGLLEDYSVPRSYAHSVRCVED
jgi:uncharacterized protein (TIGR02145 family)